MNFRQLRNLMVDEQIRSRGITDAAVLDAMRRVPRHKFVPPAALNLAYGDGPVAIGEGQTVSQPYMVALMTQCLHLAKNKTVLEVGTGSGYQTAVLAELCREVCSVERIKVLGERARALLNELKYANVRIYIGDGSQGVVPQDKLFDGIIVTAASPARPQRLLAQLALNGRLVVPVGDRLSQMLKLFIKTADGITEKDVCACTFVPLIGKDGWTG